MTNFLRAGIINDTVSDINEKTGELKQYLAENRMQDLKKGLEELEEMAQDLWVFIERFPCQPFIYTGQGKTEEVMEQLEWAWTFCEEDIDKWHEDNKKRLKNG